MNTRARKLRGLCPVCGRDISLSAVNHLVGYHMGAASVCPGAGKPATPRRQAHAVLTYQAWVAVMVALQGDVTVTRLAREEMIRGAPREWRTPDEHARTDRSFRRLRRPPWKTPWTTRGFPNSPRSPW